MMIMNECASLENLTMNGDENFETCQGCMNIYRPVHQSVTNVVHMVVSCHIRFRQQFIGFGTPTSELQKATQFIGCFSLEKVDKDAFQKFSTW